MAQNPNQFDPVIKRSRRLRKPDWAGYWEEMDQKALENPTKTFNLLKRLFLLEAINWLHTRQAASDLVDDCEAIIVSAWMRGCTANGGKFKRGPVAWAKKGVIKNSAQRKFGRNKKRTKAEAAFCEDRPGHYERQDTATIESWDWIQTALSKKKCGDLLAQIIHLRHIEKHEWSEIKILLNTHLSQQRVGQIGKEAFESLKAEANEWLRANVLFTSEQPPPEGK